MMIKYRVSDIAKDLNVPSKEIVELLAKYVQPAKKSATALEESELDIIFEHYTQKSAVESLDAYFAEGAKREEKKAAETVAQVETASKEDAAAEAAAPAKAPAAGKPAATAQKADRLRTRSPRLLPSPRCLRNVARWIPASPRW